MPKTRIEIFKVTCPFCNKVFFETEDDCFERCPYCKTDLISDEVLYNKMIGGSEEITKRIEIDYVTGEVIEVTN